MNIHNSNILGKKNTTRSKSKKKENTQLTERVYEEMLSNYYMTKYTKLMSKITKEDFNINYNTTLNNNGHNNQNQNIASLQFQSQRKNYGSNLPNTSNLNNRSKRKNFKELIREKQRKSQLSLEKGKIAKNQNKNNKKQVAISSPHRCQNLKNSPKNQRSSKGSSSPRKNFKQSMIEKSKEELQYRQNIQTYKKLQSSIIKQLYSPSPKKIQSGKYSSIQLRNMKIIQKASHNNQDSLFPQNSNQSIRSNRSNRNSIKSSEYPYQNNIEIVEYQYEQDDHQSLQGVSQLEIERQHQFDNRINPFNRQTIRSLTKRRQIMERYSPMKGSSRKSIQQSLSNQKGVAQQRAPWNRNFSNSNTFNKSLSNASSQDGSKSSPRKKQQKVTKQNNTKLTSSYIQAQKSNQNKVFQSQKINKIQQTDNEYSHSHQPEYFFQKFQNQNGNIKENDFYIPQEDGDIQFILPINQGLNSSHRNNLDYRNEYSLGDNLTERQKLILQQNNEQANLENTNTNSKKNGNSNFNRSQVNYQSKNPSLNHSINQISMISRFSMTQDEGALIKEKLDHQIINNEFGPYQNALADLRDLIQQFPTAWPIYVVGQRILDDRDQYQSKRQLQKSIMTDYLLKSETIKQSNLKKRNQNDQQYKIRQNKLKILRLVRAIANRTIQTS